MRHGFFKAQPAHIENQMVQIRLIKIFLTELFVEIHSSLFLFIHDPFRLGVSETIMGFHELDAIVPVRQEKHVKSFIKVS